MTRITERLVTVTDPAVVLAAGLRWLYGTVQHDDAIVDRRGATLPVRRNRNFRFVPVSSSGTPLVIVDVANIQWALGPVSPPLNPLGADELPCLTKQLVALGIPPGAQHYHGITGTLVLDLPAHRTLRAAVHRYDAGCPRHHTQLCGAPVHFGGQSCPWYADGRRRALWPTVSC
jgi:hypothetical protein